MSQSSGSFGPRHKLHNHFAFQASQTIDIPSQEIDGKDVDIIIMDCGIDAAHYEFLDDEGKTRVQMVNWNYLAANPDSLFDDWRTHDITMREIHEAIKTSFDALRSAGRSHLFTAPNGKPWYCLFSDSVLYNEDNNLAARMGLYGPDVSADGVDRRQYLPYIPSNHHGMSVASRAAGKSSCASGANIYSLGNTFATPRAPFNKAHDAEPEQLVYLFHRCKQRSGITRPTILVNSTGIGQTVSAVEVEANYFEKDGGGNYQTDTPIINNTLTSSIFGVTKSIADATTGGARYDIRPKYDQSGILQY